MAMLLLALLFLPRFLHRKARKGTEEAREQGPSRRRHRRPPGHEHLLRIALSLLLPGATILLPARPTLGQVDGERFRPAPSSLDGIGLRRATPLPFASGSFGLHLSGAGDSLIFYKDGRKVDEVVGTRLGSTVTAALGFGRNMDLSVGVPLTLYQSAGPIDPGGSAPASTKAGDTALHLRWRSFGGQAEGSWAVAGSLGVLATHRQPERSHRFRGLGPLAMVLSELPIGPTRLLLNVGVQLREEIQTADLRVGSALTGGAGLTWNLRSSLQILGRSRRDPCVAALRAGGGDPARGPARPPVAVAAQAGPDRGRGHRA